LFIDSIGYYGGFDIQTLTNIDNRDVWNITWQSYSVSPFAFCSNTDHTDDVVSPSGQGNTEDWSKPAMREHIELFKTSVNGKFIGASNAYVYKTMSQSYYLNPTEIEILKKVSLQKSPVYHYPIVTHITVKQGPINTKKYDDAIANEIDHIVDLPNECPYEFATNADNTDKWEWLKVGDDVTQTKTKTSIYFERKEIWWGFKDIDKNFYGNGTFTHSEDGILSGRWELGKL
jgi:hypothetical protein